MATLTVDNNDLADLTVDTNTGNASDNTQRVVLADDQPAIPVDTSGGSASSATEDSGTATTASAEVVASNSSRKAGYIQNLSTSIDLHVSFGGTATTSSPRVPPGGSLSFTVGGVVYTGAVNARSASSTVDWASVEL